MQIFNKLPNNRSADIFSYMVVYMAPTPLLQRFIFVFIHFLADLSCHLYLIEWSTSLDIRTWHCFAFQINLIEILKLMLFM